MDDWVKLVTEANKTAKTDFGKAVTLYEEGEKKFSGNPLFLLHFGKLYHDVKKYKEAIQCYDKSLEIEPNDATTLNNKGLALRNLGRYEEAIQCYDKSLEIRPNDATTLKNKRIALKDMNK